MDLRPLRGSLFLWMLLLSSFLGIAFLHHVLLSFVVVLPLWYRKFADQLIGYWMSYCAVTVVSVPLISVPEICFFS